MPRELIQVAAVVVAWVEEINNGGARSRLIFGFDGFPLGAAVVGGTPE